MKNESIKEFLKNSKENKKDQEYIDEQKRELFKGEDTVHKETLDVVERINREERLRNKRIQNDKDKEAIKELSNPNLLGSIIDEDEVLKQEKLDEQALKNLNNTNLLDDTVNEEEKKVQLVVDEIAKASLMDESVLSVNINIKGDEDEIIDFGTVDNDYTIIKSEQIQLEDEVDEQVRIYDNSDEDEINNKYEENKTSKLIKELRMSEVNNEKRQEQAQLSEQIQKELKEIEVDNLAESIINQTEKAIKDSDEVIAEVNETVLKYASEISNIIDNEIEQQEIEKEQFATFTSTTESYDLQHNYFGSDYDDTTYMDNEVEHSEIDTDLGGEEFEALNHYNTQQSVNTGHYEVEQEVNTGFGMDTCVKDYSDIVGFDGLKRENEHTIDKINEEVDNMDDFMITNMTEQLMEQRQLELEAERELAEYQQEQEMLDILQYSDYDDFY